MTEKRRVYDRDFKISAVKLVFQDERTMKEVAADLGVNYYTLAEWKSQYEKKGERAFAGHGRLVYDSESEKEIAELRKRPLQTGRLTSYKAPIVGSKTFFTN